MNALAPVHLLLNRLAYPARKDMVRSVFAQAALYTTEELEDCVATLPYPDAFWNVLGADEIARYVKYPKLWTDPEGECFHNLRSIFLEDLKGHRDAAYRFVHAVYPLTRRIPDWTYENAFDVLRKPAEEAEAYVASIQPKTSGLIEMKKKEYLDLMACAETAAVGTKLATALLRTQYHPVVANYMCWPASKALIATLLRQKLEYRARILGLHDAGWVPENYIDLCCSPLAWEADEVRAYTEAGAGAGGDAHARDVRV